jgi:hypothetical protein
LNVTYSVNGKPITFENLKKIQVTRKDYIDYMESIKKQKNNFGFRQ